MTLLHLILMWNKQQQANENNNNNNNKQYHEIHFVLLVNRSTLSFFSPPDVFVFCCPDVSHGQIGLRHFSG